MSWMSSFLALVFRTLLAAHQHPRAMLLPKVLRRVDFLTRLTAASAFRFPGVNGAAGLEPLESFPKVSSRPFAKVASWTILYK